MTAPTARRPIATRTAGAAPARGPTPGLVLLALWTGAALSLGGCGERVATPAPAASAAAGPTYVALARGRVDVEGGLVGVVAPRAGVVRRWHVAEGDTVRAGQILAEFDSTEAALAVGQVEAEIAQLRAGAVAQQSRLPAARDRAQRLAQGVQAGVASQQDAEDARQAVREIEAERGVQAAALSVARQRLAAARHAVQLSQVRAPVDGKVGVLRAPLGAAVEAQGALLQLIPHTPWVVQAELNEAIADKVRPGMRAQVVPAAADGMGVAATVMRIGDVYGAPRAGNEPDAPVADARVVSATLRLEPTAAATPALRIGQRVVVKFLP